MARHRGLLIAWIVTVSAFLLAWVTGSTALAILPHLVAMVLSVITVRRVELTGELRRPALYRLPLLLLALATATVVIAAGSTVVITSGTGTRVAGFVAQATTNLAVAIAAWRAIVRPSPRRGALVGLAAVITELFAIVLDVAINFDNGALDEPAVPVALLASWAASWLGALACMGALAAFDRTGTVAVPSARVVDEGD